MDTIEGEEVQKLYDVRLFIDGMAMVSDSVWRFLNRGETRAFGNIQIDTDEETIWADTLYYFKNQELSYLRGRVVIVQDSTTLFGESVDYSFLTKIATFNSGIRLEDQDGTLVALQGIYFQQQDSAIFRQQVQLSDSAQYAEGDSLFINRKKELLQMHSNMFVADSTNNAILTGDYLEADSTGRRYVDGNAYLRKISSDTTDTTHINSKELLMLETDSTDYIRGYGNVRVWSTKFSSVSDTLLYNSTTEQFQLIQEPKAWHKDIQLTGPYISVQLDSSDIKQLKSYQGAIAVEKDSLTERFHQIKGDTLTAYFTEGEISSIQIFPNSHVLYHLADENDKADGAVEYTSPKTTMTFGNGSLARVKAGQNKGYYIPENEKLADRTLEGFTWDPQIRPQKPITKARPRFPQVPKEPPFELPRRYLEFLLGKKE
ncbi:MAG: hypothetical protein FH748_00350 [Balneolaceae bacterium]|nr:hypothetical protein [Balneolaceae bacterium]